MVVGCSMLLLAQAVSSDHRTADAAQYNSGVIVH